MQMVLDEGSLACLSVLQLNSPCTAASAGQGSVPACCQGEYCGSGLCHTIEGSSASSTPCGPGQGGASSPCPGLCQSGQSLPQLWQSRDWCPGRSLMHFPVSAAASVSPSLLSQSQTLLASMKSVVISHAEAHAGL